MAPFAEDVGDGSSGKEEEERIFALLSLVFPHNIGREDQWIQRVATRDIAQSALCRTPREVLRMVDAHLPDSDKLSLRGSSRHFGDTFGMFKISDPADAPQLHLYLQDDL